MTASGGAFRDYDSDRLSSVKASDALKHPNWNMGAKITVDCATMVNKAFEVIEAKWLYKCALDKIDVIIHRESIIHSMVEFCDGATIAQLSYPTMELPIHLALTYPNRLISNVKGLNFAKLGKLTFEELDEKKYPCFNTVLSCAKKGGIYTALVNGANDMAVEMFLKDKIAYGDIYKALNAVIDGYDLNFKTDLEGLILANDYAKSKVKEMFGD